MKKKKYLKKNYPEKNNNNHLPKHSRPCEDDDS